MALLKYPLCIFLSLVALQWCSSKNRAEPFVEKTPDEKAQAALKSGDYDGAISILNDAIASEPTNYERYCVLGATYAAKSGFDLFQAFSADIAGASDSILDQVSIFLPSEITQKKIDTLQTAIVTLKKIPLDGRQKTSANTYGTSANFQLTLYAASHSMMTLKLVSATQSSSKLDPNQLNSLSDDQVASVLDHLKESAQAAGAQDPALQAKIDEAIVGIDAQPGATKKEKLINYIATQQ